MGCGSSGATATKSENAAELKKENQEKQEMEDNTPEVFNYPGCALLYVEPGTFTLYDLTDTFISPEGHRLYEDASLGTENPNN